jgi:hypothetical protein
MGELRELGPQGDSRLMWDADKEAEVEAAKDTFDKLREKGYFAYKVKKKGGRGKVITKFDPQAEKIILALPMRGG